MSAAFFALQQFIAHHQFCSFVARRLLHIEKREKTRDRRPLTKHSREGAKSVDLLRLWDVNGRHSSTTSQLKQSKLKFTSSSNNNMMRWAVSLLALLYLFTLSLGNLIYRDKKAHVFRVKREWRWFRHTTHISHANEWIVKMLVMKRSNFTDFWYDTRLIHRTIVPENCIKWYSDVVSELKSLKVWMSYSRLLLAFYYDYDMTSDWADPDISGDDWRHSSWESLSFKRMCDRRLRSL